MQRALNEILRDLLDERRATPEISILATEALSLPVRRSAARVLTFLSDSAPSVVRERVPAFLAELARRDDRWDRVVRSALRSRGRCPAGLRSALRAAMAARALAQAPVQPLEETESGAARAQTGKLQVSRGRIVMSTEASSVFGIPTLLRALTEAGVPRRTQIDLTGCEHVYIVGLATLATWLLQSNVRAEVVGASPETERYLQVSGFMDAIEGRPHPVGERDAGRRVALERILPNAFSDELASRIVRILDDHGLVAAGNRNSLVICFAELIENVARHAGQGAIGFVGAEYYPQHRKLTVVVADAGMGVRRSFDEGRNAELRRRMAREDPLRLAVLPLVTSKPVTSEHATGHAGYGLFLASEIAVRNRGTFRITSDARSLTLFQRNGRRRAETLEHARWQGTIVSLLLDLDNVVSIRDVYQTLPLPAGFAPEDFFS